MKNPKEKPEVEIIMPTSNIWATKLLAKFLWGVLVAIIFFMGNVVRGNDLNNRTDHEKINETISDFRVEQMRQGTILERIDKKIP